MTSWSASVEEEKEQLLEHVSVCVCVRARKCVCVCVHSVFVFAHVYSVAILEKNCRVGLTVVLHDYQEYDCL